MLHSHVPYVLNHGRWPHGSDWLCEAAVDTYLPLISRLRHLADVRVATPLTIGLTPVLANQLAHLTFASELNAYFAHRLAACDDAKIAMKKAEDAELLPIVAFWRGRLERLRDTWNAIDQDIPGEFRRLQNEGRLEITTSAATHALLPLLARDESMRLQLAVGKSEHRRLFGSDSAGCWVPECAYRARSDWTTLPSSPSNGVRRGIEEHLQESGFRYSFADAHMAHAGPTSNVYGELFGTIFLDVAQCGYRVEVARCLGAGRTFLGASSERALQLIIA
ncbi:MAG: hypothetical protein ABIT38_08815 [Gemmatimonadaceae bacterium]